MRYGYALVNPYSVLVFSFYFILFYTLRFSGGGGEMSVSVLDAMSASIKKHPTKTYTRSQISISENVQGDNLENERQRHKINKVGDGGAGIGYDSIGEDIID